ncbi:MAG: hypothetical protein GF330_06770 [Candidatus Eisenbacteria bacterium]|nr:hypothetical protein [Candidatus Eisenbacteria bacterium]
MRDPETESLALRTGPGFRAVLVSLMRIVAKLSALAEEDLDQLRATTGGRTDDLPRWGGAIYGFYMGTVAGREGPVLVTSFGNVGRAEGGDPVVHAEREPLTELVDRGDGIEIRMELPGIRAEDLRLEVCGSELHLRARRGDYRYAKELRLPWPCPPERHTISCECGVLTIHCPI